MDAGRSRTVEAPPITPFRVSLGSGWLANPWTIAASIFAVSRALAYAGGLYGARYLAETNPAVSAGGVADMVLKWDAGLYTSIAINGYTWDPTYNAPVTVAFFPLYPLLISIVSGLLRLIAPGFDWWHAYHGSYVAAGLLISALCFYFILVLLIKLLQPRVGLRGASLIAVGMAAVPTSFFLTEIYTESLFIMLVLLAFVFARSELTAKWLWAGLVGMLAALTRSAGLLLLPALLIDYLSQHGWQWRRIRAEILLLGLVPVGTGLYMAFLWWRFGDPLWAVRIQSVPPWSRSTPLPPWETYYEHLRVFWRSIRGGFGPGLDPLLNTGQGRRIWFALDLLLPAIMVAGAWWARKKVLASEWVWLALSIIFPLSTGSTQSMSRFALTFWPGLLWLGTVGKWGRFVAIPLLLASMLLMAWLSAEFSMGRWVG